MSSGIRFGTADLYDVVGKFEEVEDCVAVGQRRPDDQDEQVLIFLKLRDSGLLQESLRSRISNAIREMLSPRHVPAHVIQVKDIPYTMNGKKIEKAVKSVVCGQELKMSGSIINPDCLKEYEQFRHLPTVRISAKL